MEMEVFSVTTFTFLVIAIIFLHKLFSLLKPSTNVKLPPGPFPLPIIGSLYQIGNLPHKPLTDLAKIHGPIMSVKLGSTTAVVFSSPETAREILQKQDLVFSTRDVPDSMHAHHHSKYSIFFLPVSTRWRSMRKILHTHMLSMNRLNANQQLTNCKIQDMITYCRKSSELGEPVDIGQLGYSTLFNLLSNIMFSTDLEIKELVWNFVIDIGKTNLVDFFPWFKRFDLQGRRRQSSAHLRKILQIINDFVSQRLGTRNLGENDVNFNADVLDVCLNIAQENPNEIDREHMNRMFFDLFVGGTDTTSSTLEWAMSELLRNPDKMTKTKLELKQVIGQGKTLNDSDIPNLPYLNCVIKESLRLYPPGPFLIPRKVETDVDVFGYVIPKGSQVLVNIYAIGRDPTIWEDPLSFKPERFLDSGLDVGGQNFEFLPFGSGRRICPGISLSMRILPLMLGSLLNCFDWRIEGGVEPENLDMKEKFGLTMRKDLPLLAIPTLITPDN